MNENSLLSSESTIWQIQFLLKGENQRLSRNLYSQRGYSPINYIKCAEFLKLSTKLHLMH